jgi:hypothetical protein
MGLLDYDPNPSTLAQHLKARFDKSIADTPGCDMPPEPTIGAFVAFCDAEMSRNGISTTGYGAAGMTATLVDGCTVLLDPGLAGGAMERPSGVVPVTGHRQRFGRDMTDAGAIRIGGQ